jgi:hypothetical protein
VDRIVEDSVGGFHNTLGQSRVGVDRSEEFFDGRLTLQRYTSFVNEVGGVRAHDMDS